METNPLLKIVIAGESQVGKTSLVCRLCEGRFDAAAAPTIGVNLQTHQVVLAGGQVKLSIWDMAGKERFSVVRTGFYHGCLAAALVYDLSAPETLKQLARWYVEIRRVLPELSFLVVGNKTDLAPAASDREAQQFARLIHASLLRTSAASGEGVGEMFAALAQLAVDRLATQGI